MTRYNSQEPGAPCLACGAPTTREISVNEVCTRCNTYVEDCECTRTDGSEKG